jgi:uroporphyrinogen decarboxylase
MGTAMTSRERVRRALSFEEADRIPTDWGEVGISGIHEVAYGKLLKHLSKQEDIFVSDKIQRLAKPSEDILNLFQVDTRCIFAHAAVDSAYQENPDGSFRDEFGAVYRRCGLYSDFVESPLGSAETIVDLRSFKMPDPTDPKRFKGLRTAAERMYVGTDKAIVAGSGASLYYTAWILRGYERFLCDVALKSKFAEYLLDMVLDWYMAFMDKYLQEIGEFVQIMWVGDDWGTQNGPIIDPAEFRSNVVPRVKKLIAFMKSKSPAKLAYHSCGSVFWAMNDFVDMGVDILHPVQANAAEMLDSGRLKRLFHGKLAFHGGLDNQGKFHLSKEQVVEEVKDKIRAFAPGGGYIFSSGHNIQANCPPENIMAIFQTARQYGSYPIRVP